MTPPCLQLGLCQSSVQRGKGRGLTGPDGCPPVLADVTYCRFKADKAKLRLDVATKGQRLKLSVAGLCGDFERPVKLMSAFSRMPREVLQAPGHSKGADEDCCLRRT